MRVGIHQPNFMPWLPWWQKMEQCDLFVILGRCQFEKGKFQNRFNHDGKWYTMAVEKGNIPIREKKYKDPQFSWSKIKKSLPGYNLDQLDWTISTDLWLTNCGIILQLKHNLGIHTEMTFDEPTDKTGTDRLVEICQQHGATEYLAGASGGDYMDYSLFDQAGIKVITQETKPEDKVSILHKLK